MQARNFSCASTQETLVLLEHVEFKRVVNTEHLADEPVPVTVTVLAQTLSRVVRPVRSNGMFILS